MGEAVLDRFTSCGVTLLGDRRRPCGVTLAFTERTGGVSEGPYASLNLGDACGDDPAAVAENRLRACRAVGAGECAGLLVNPRQVHGDHVVLVGSADPSALAAARREARSGADAVACTVPGVPVLLCYADCVPVVLVVPGGFAVVHSGWRGSIARISGKALQALCDLAGTTPSQARAYVGPHIGTSDYEVSQDLLDRFVAEFGPEVDGGSRHLDLGRAVRRALEDAGVPAARIADAGVSTASATDRFFSHRAEGGHTGRHGAIAWMADTGRDGMGDGREESVGAGSDE